MGSEGAGGCCIYHSFGGTTGWLWVWCRGRAGAPGPAGEMFAEQLCAHLWGGIQRVTSEGDVLALVSAYQPLSSSKVGSCCSGPKDGSFAGKESPLCPEAPEWLFAVLLVVPGLLPLLSPSLILRWGLEKSALFWFNLSIWELLLMLLRMFALFGGKGRLTLGGGCSWRWCAAEVEAAQLQVPPGWCSPTAFKSDLLLFQMCCPTSSAAHPSSPGTLTPNKHYWSLAGLSLATALHLWSLTASALARDILGKWMFCYWILNQNPN